MPLLRDLEQHVAYAVCTHVPRQWGRAANMFTNTSISCPPYSQICLWHAGGGTFIRLVKQQCEVSNFFHWPAPTSSTFFVIIIAWWGCVTFIDSECRLVLDLQPFLSLWHCWSHWAHTHLIFLLWHLGNLPSALQRPNRMMTQWCHHLPHHL